MASRLDLRLVEQQLDARGYSREVRNAIRNSRIALVDDRIEDLRGLIEGLRAEGFNNLVEMPRVTSVEDILARRFDLVILDLTGVAAHFSSDDGFGVLSALKASDPTLPILVVTGTTTPPDKVSVVSKADLVRSKPVKPLELAADIEQLLRPYKDQFWAALEVLKELRRLDADLRGELPVPQRLLVWWRKRQLSKALGLQVGSTTEAIVSIGKAVAGLGAAATKLMSIADKVGQ